MQFLGFNSLNLKSSNKILKENNMKIIKKSRLTLFNFARKEKIETNIK